MFSEELGKNIKLNNKTGAVIVEQYKTFGDTSKLVKYTAGECQIIRETIGKISKKVHMVKVCFDGQIIKK